MAIFTNTSGLPPLPEYELRLQTELIPGIPDKVSSMLFIFVAYWVLSMIFHWIDVYDLFPQYRLHTPAEILKRNHVSRYEVVRDVLVQQIVQTAVGIALGMTEPDDMIGREQYDIAIWARRIRVAESAIPALLAVFSINAHGLASNLAISHPILSGMVAGGSYPTLSHLAKSSTGAFEAVPDFAAWEMLLAKAIYHVLIPAVQFGAAIVFLDAWQYFIHRAMHMNKFLYTHIHSRHHRLYVPYAYGALYNHALEGFLLDSVGSALAFKFAGMTTRQGICFFTGSTLKTVDDHCGYAFPWDPLQHLTSNNAGYHDIHHQSWGIKTNFSQPFFTFWDRILGTMWTGGDVSARYERARVLAQKRLDADISATSKAPFTGDTDDAATGPYANATQGATLLHNIPEAEQQPQPPAGTVAAQQAASRREQVLADPAGGRNVLIEEAQEEKEALAAARRSSTRRRAASDGLKGLRERVSAHGRTAGILGMEKSG